MNHRSRPRRSRRSVGLPIVLVVAAGLLACSSPNRGYWSGSFDGSVSGIVEFTINARGTKIKGKMTGETSEGQPFHATLEGTLRQDFIKADFEGKSGNPYGLPIPFEGEMTGSLEGGIGAGDWSAQLWANSYDLFGTWSVEQQDR